MEPLPVHHEDATFTYDQVERDGDIAIFRQTHKVGKVERFEVIKIRIRPEQVWPDGRITPEHEAYPSSGQWGTLAFTTYTLEQARTLAQQLRALQAHPAPVTVEAP